MNEPLIRELVEIINTEIRLFNRLLDLLKEEQQALLDDDIAAIEACTQAKRRTAEEATGLEVRRRRVVDGISVQLNLQPGDPGLSRIIEAIDRGPGEQLAQMRQTLLDLNQKIRDANGSNAFLIRQSRRYTERCMSILSGRPQDRGRYGKSGRRLNEAGRNLLNRTA